MKMQPQCLECGNPISWGIHLFSRRIYGVSLCMEHQCRLEDSGMDARVIDLYLALRSQNIPLELGYFDGNSILDMAIPGKLNIEISGFYQEAILRSFTESRNLLMENKIPTIIIPISSLRSKDRFDHMVKEISKACNQIMKPVPGLYMNFVPPLMNVQLQ